MPDPKYSKPSEQWTAAERADYSAQISLAREAAFASGNPNVICESTGSLRSAASCFTSTKKKSQEDKGCAHCAGALAAASKQTELTGYDPTKETR